MMRLGVRMNLEMQSISVACSLSRMCLRLVAQSVRV